MKKNLVLPRSFIEIEIIRKKDAVYLRQKRLISKLLDDNNMRECKPVRTPNSSGTEIRETDKNALDENGASTYRSIVESLLYIATKTRPDFCVAANSLGAHVDYPCDYHMVATKLVLRYLKGTLER